VSEQQPPERPEQPGWRPPPEQQPGPPAWGPPPGQPGQPPAWGPPPGQPGPPPGYGYPGYGAAGYGPAGYGPQTSGKATTVLVLGIVSLVMMVTCGLGFVTAIISLVLAPGASREIAESGGRLTGDSQVRTGRILSWVTLGLTALGLLILAVFIGIAVSVDTSGSGGESPAITPG